MSLSFREKVLLPEPGLPMTSIFCIGVSMKYR